jgi:hypothetical protein
MRILKKTIVRVTNCFILTPARLAIDHGTISLKIYWAQFLAKTFNKNHFQSEQGICCASIYMITGFLGRFLLLHDIKNEATGVLPKC